MVTNVSLSNPRCSTRVSLVAWIFLLVAVVMLQGNGCNARSLLGAASRSVESGNLVVAANPRSTSLRDPSQAPNRKKYPQGVRSLFIGHSFFVPVAKQFDTFAQMKNGAYPNHDMQHFFKGGNQGSPIYLWDNHKDEIEAMLSSGDIDLFGMTVAAGDSELPPAELLNGYSQWVDLALTYNPNTSFFIGLPWPDFPSSYGSAEDYAVANQGNAAIILSGVTVLREKYRNTDIHFLSYGAVPAKAMTLLEQGKLVGVTDMIGTADTSIFTDEKGHAGSMVKDLAALSWLHFFYGTPFGVLVNGAATYLGWDKGNVREILQAVYAANI